MAPRGKNTSEDVPPEVLAARAKLAARSGKTARTGGKGTVRRKQKAAPKSSNDGDKRLQATLKRLGVQPIPAEECDLFLDDGNVVHFKQPRLSASPQSNLFVLQGASETKPFTDMIPPELLAQFQQAQAAAQAAQEGAAAGGIEEIDDDDDVPELDSNFDEVDD